MLSLFNYCSLNVPDNDKVPQSLTTFLLTHSLLSLSASYSLHSLLRFVLLYDTQGRFDGIPSHHLNVPIHLKVKPEREGKSEKYQLQLHREQSAKALECQIPLAT